MSNHTATVITDPLISYSTHSEYSELLDHHGFKYEQNDCYWMVGEPSKTQGWEFHISIVISQMRDFLGVILPFLKEINAPFRLAKDQEMVETLLNGTLGYSKQGKIMGIYIEEEGLLYSIAQQLIHYTSQFKGPDIITSIHLGACVYTRYERYESVGNMLANGLSADYIESPNGNQERDNYDIPYVPPAWAAWPFLELGINKNKESRKKFNPKFYPAYILKTDIKGNVIKGLYFKRSLLFSWCILKEGRRNMLSDEAGNDIIVRLQWQRELHEILAGEVGVPRIIDYFEYEGNGYLAMDFIKGNDLHDKIRDIYKGRIWTQLTIVEKEMIIHYIKQILHAVKAMHAKGIVHRDITPTNFLVKKDGTLALIDLELSYSMALKYPEIPFKLGTPGFMSPEQRSGETPTIKEDIYALGAILITMLTALQPAKFSNSNPQRVQACLSYFIPDEELVQTITACTRQNPAQRPDLANIETAIRYFSEHQLRDSGRNPVSKHDNRDDNIKLINDAILGLSAQPQVSRADQWLSKARSQKQLINAPTRQLTTYSYFQDGIAGIAYTLSKAACVGINIESCQIPFKKGWQFIDTDYITNRSNMPSGLYNGTAGIALAMAEGIKAGMISYDRDIIGHIVNLLQQSPMIGLDIADGLAGIGMTILNCQTIFGQEFMKEVMQAHVDRILEAQDKNGIWLKEPGYSYGNAGILSFLIAYAGFTQNGQIIQAIERSCHWLERHVQKNLAASGFGMNEGRAGMALAFIKAYELLGKKEHKEITYKILHSYPYMTSNDDISLLSGLSGVGEVLIEYQQVFKSGSWQQQITDIQNLISHTYIEQEKGGKYWLMDDLQMPSPALINGNAGVIHFLLRCTHPEQLAHPLFPILKSKNKEHV